MRTDWRGVESTPEFQELVRRRRSFVLPCTVFFLVYYLLFIALAGYAPDFMGERVYEGLTVGYVLALTQFVMVWVLGALYLRRSAKVFDPLREKVMQSADAPVISEIADDRDADGRLTGQGAAKPGEGAVR